MKKIKKGFALTLSLVLINIIVACNADKNNNQGSAENTVNEETNIAGEENTRNNEVSPIMESYVDIQDALVEDNAEAAREAAKEMMEERKVDDELNSSLEGISNAEDLKTQRKHFNELSQQLYEMAKKGEVEGEIYWNHCPMAMNNEGANWLSVQKDIQNPYMGQSMPKCGTVEEVLNSK